MAPETISTGYEPSYLTLSAELGVWVHHVRQLQVKVLTMSRVANDVSESRDAMAHALADHDLEASIRLRDPDTARAYCREHGI